MVRRRRFQQGHVFKSGKKRVVWKARWSEPVLCADGTIRKVLRSEIIAEYPDVPTRSQAQALLSERLRDLNRGLHRPRAVGTFQEFVQDHWEPKMLPTFRPSTAEIYRINLHKHLLPYFGDTRLCDLKAADVQEFVVEKAGTGLARNTVKHFRDLLSRILRTAEEWEFVSSNAARKVRLPPKQLKRPPRVITVEQLQSLLLELPEPVRTMVLLCVFTGVRAGELFALRWRHVDFTSGVIQIRESVHNGEFGPPKTTSGCRDLPMGSVVLCALLEHRKKPMRAEPNDLVFPSRRGTALGRNNLLRRVLYPACDRVGIPRVGWHSFRHLHATLLSETGQPLRVAQAQLGHSDVQTTLGTYTHVLPGSQRAAVQEIEALVFPTFPKFCESTENGRGNTTRIQ